jgi:CHASE3 domain sensor protein
MSNNQIIQVNNNQIIQVSSNIPQPIQVREDGKKLYILDGYRIWADTYKAALENLDRIQRF